MDGWRVGLLFSARTEVHRVHVHKRPGLEVFLKEMAQVYELVCGQRQ